MYCCSAKIVKDQFGQYNSWNVQNINHELYNSVAHIMNGEDFGEAASSEYHIYKSFIFFKFLNIYLSISTLCNVHFVNW